MLAHPLSPGRLGLPVIRQDSELLTVLMMSSATHQICCYSYTPFKGRGSVACLPSLPLFVSLCLSLWSDSASLYLCLCLSALCLSVSVSLHLCISFSFHEAAPHFLSLSLPSPTKQNKTKLSTQALFARCVLLFLTRCGSSWLQPVKVSLAPFSNIGSESRQALPAP